MQRVYLVSSSKTSDVFIGGFETVDGRRAGMLRWKIVIIVKLKCLMDVSSCCGSVHSPWLVFSVLTDVQFRFLQHHTDLRRA